MSELSANCFDELCGKLQKLLGVLAAGVTQIIDPKVVWPIVQMKELEKRSCIYGIISTDLNIGFGLPHRLKQCRTPQIASNRRAIETASVRARCSSAATSCSALRRRDRASPPPARRRRRLVDVTRIRRTRVATSWR